MDTNLRLDWCSYQAAKYAVENWHYSKAMPAGKLLKIGAWENRKFIGCIIFSLGSNKNIGNPYGLKMTQVCELTRIALSKHISPVSKILSIAVGMLKKQSPGIELIVSYADTEQNHLGLIYQASNWLYVGTIKTTPFHFVNGKWVKQRTASSFLGSVVGTITKPGYDKIKYLLPLNKKLYKQLKPLVKPYPKKNNCGRGEINSSPQPNEEMAV